MSQCVSETVRHHLFSTATELSRDLIDIFAPRIPDLETQVLVVEGPAKPSAKPNKGKLYYDGQFTWHRIRVPKLVDGKPSFNDYPLRFPLADYATSIGTNGRDWRTGESLYVGFDFDAIEGHAEGVGVSDAELHRITEALRPFPYLMIRRSPSGKGLHVWVFLNGVRTADRHEHAALALVLLRMLSQATGLDLIKLCDKRGEILWLWKRSASEHKRSFELLKPATGVLTEADLPPDWRNQIAERATKVKIDFSKLSAAVPLDERHKRTIAALQQLGYSCSWDAEHNLLRVHSAALAELFGMASAGIRGYFATTPLRMVNEPTDVLSP